MTESAPVKDKCRKGHVLTPENSYAIKGGRTGCKTCKRIGAAKQTQHAANKRAAAEKRIADLAKDADRKRKINPDAERAELQKVALALKELERRRRERKLDFYEPYPKQIEFHTLGATKHEISLIASNRCVSPWTWVETPEGLRRSEEAFFSEGASVLAWDGERRQTVQVSEGIRKGLLPTYRVVLDSGQWFDCSANHQVLTALGYLSFSLIMSHANGLHLKRTPEGWKASYAKDGRRYDRQPLVRLDNGPDGLRETGDVLLLGRYSSQAGGGGQAPRHTTSPCAGRRPNRDVIQTLSDLFDESSSALAAPPELQLQCGILDTWRSLSASGAYLQSWNADSASVFYASSRPSIGGRTIIAVVPLGLQQIIDCHVPKWNNYIGPGVVHHNSGKTYSAAAEVAMHLTGLYPSNWPGRRFDNPIRMWSCGVTGLVVRDVNQKLLFGPPGVEQEQGTGMVPKECVDWKNGVSTSRGYSDAFDTVQVRHVTGGISTVAFKSYEQGRAKFQAETLDLIHCDEEPPIDIYSECIVRLATTGGLMLCTFTPLLGMSEVVIRYLQEPSPDRAFINMTIDDALHFSDEERVRIIAAYPAHEREARAKGIPMLGSGAIFQVSDESITEDPIPLVPGHWAKGIGMDFGIDHPFAGVLMAWDRDADCVHLLKIVKMKDARAIDHAAAMRPWGDVRAFWPHDGSTRDKGSGETLASMYKKHGVKMYQTHSSFIDGSISTEAGIMEMQERMTTGRFKVSRDLAEWFTEKRMYHRKDGMIVKQNDDLLSATRVGLMMKRYWKAGYVGEGERVAQQGAGMCAGLDFDIFTGA